MSIIVAVSSDKTPEAFVTSIILGTPDTF